MPISLRYPWLITGTCISIAFMLLSCGGAQKYSSPTAIASSSPVDNSASENKNACQKPRNSVFPPQYTSTLAGKLSSPTLTELSGLAPSRINKDIFWGINDSGHNPVIYALKQDGTHAGSFTLQGAENTDWEDISSFNWKGESWLMIADTGDNAHRHDTAHLYFIKEPDLTKYSLPNALPLDNWQQMEFTYPDGAQDIEAAAVSCFDSTIYLVSKDGPHSLYTLPLDFESGDTLREAKKVGTVQPLPSNDAENPFIMAIIGTILMKPTALDFSDDGTRAVITNYRHVYAYQRQTDQTWVEALQTPASSVVDFELSQCESICFLPGSENILFASEGRKGELMQGTIK